MPSSNARARCIRVAAEIEVLVAYAEPGRQTVVTLRVPSGTTVSEVIERSAIRTLHPGIPADAALGIHGRRVSARVVVESGDRVEIYRPLPADPKDTRRRLAREGRTMARTLTARR